MLGKLLKYENKTLSKILVPLNIGTLALSLLSALIMKLNLVFEDRADSFLFILRSVSNTLLILSIFAIISVMFICIFLILQRYYKSFFTDEGYLTFSLPVKTRDHLLSKLITSCLWSVLTGLCVFVGVCLIMLFGTTTEAVNTDFWRFLREIFTMIGSYFTENPGGTIGLTIEMILLSISTLCAQFLMFELAITLGSIIAKKHKILASIGMYFAVYTISQIANAVLVGLLLPGTFVNSSELNLSLPGALALFLLLPLLLEIAYTIIFFLINHHLVKTKLNLD